MTPGIRLRLSLFFGALVATAFGCNSGGGGGGAEASRATGVDVPDGVVGRVLFEKRVIDGGELSGSRDVVPRPARHVRVEVVRKDGSLIASTMTDANGRYGVGGALPADFEVLAFPDSSGASPPDIRAVVRDHQGNDYAASSGPQLAIAAGERSVVNVTAGVRTDLRLGGAFNIVDVLQIAGRIWSAATGIEPNIAEVAWESGGTNQPGTFFDPSVNRIAILGGRGLPDFADTDEFDDAVVAHEYLHFLVNNHAHSSSPGGRHSGEDLVPNLAFEEGLADWFGAFATGKPFYEDTRGNADGATSCLVCDNLETSTLRNVEGIGSEQSVYELLWDICDGYVDQPLSSDADRAASSIDDMLLTLVEASAGRDFWYIGLFLEKLEARGAAARIDLQDLLSFPVDHDVSFPLAERTIPPDGRDIFPIPIAVGETVDGVVDAKSSVNVERGFDSIRYYGFVLDRRRRVTIRLEILGPIAAGEPCSDGIGRVPCDLDMALLDITNGRIAQSETDERSETITATLDAGTWIIEVRAYFLTNPENPPFASTGTYTLELR